MARKLPSTQDILPTAGDLGPSFRSAHKGIFRKEGGYWTVGYGGNTVRLKDSRGLGYIAHLLRHPDAAFHVLDLYGGMARPREEDDTGQAVHGLPRTEEELEPAGMQITGLGDAGEMLDAQAKATYRRRLSELHAELEEAKERGEVERAEHAEEEIEVLTRELSRAVGLGGRNRRAAFAAERARQSITKAIKSALDRIAESEATLGGLLVRCIKTGTFCSYHPDPEVPLTWEFAKPLTEPAEPPPANGEQVLARVDRSHPLPVVLEVSPFSLAERTAFVGREAECSAMRALIDRALSGHGSVVLLGGGPGVGKSRLALEMTEYASRVGFQCLVGHCYERDEPYPYLPFVEIIESGLAQAASLEDFRRRLGDNAAELAQLAPSLRRVFPDIPLPLDLPAAQQRFYMFRSLAEALARATRTRSYLLILEDLQWADESTLALLTHLATRITQLPVVILGTYRDGYVDANPALDRTLEELIRLGIRPLKLSGLPKEAVARMLDRLSQRQAQDNLVSVIFEGSQGNPFFVEELYRHLCEEGRVFEAAGHFRTDITSDEIAVPENVRLLIGRRLERLDENEKRVLAAAAVLGRSFNFQLLSEISQVDVDELFAVVEKAQQMGILVPSAEGPERPFTFGHELVRQTLLASISLPRQQRLHASVAAAIERLSPYAVTERAGDIADHLLKAGSFADRRRLVQYLTLDGKGALNAAAFAEARRSFRAALAHITEGNVRERADVLADLAIAERGLEQWEAASATLQEALDLYIALGDREMIARSSTELTAVFVWAGRLQEAIETARRGLASLQGDVSADQARLLAVLGQTQAAAGSWELAHEAMREALHIATHLSDPKLVARLRGTRSMVNYEFLRLREAVDDGEHSDGSEVPPWERTIERQLLYQTFLFLGHLDEAARLRGELEPLATKIGQSYSIALCRITRAWGEFGKAPDLAKLETTLQQVLQSNPKVPAVFWKVFSKVQLSLVDFLRGNWASARQHAHAACRFEAETATRGVGVGTLFRQMAYAGDHAGAAALLREKRAWLPQSGRPNTRGSWWMLVLVIEGLVILGEQPEAAQLYPLARELVATGAVSLWPICRFAQTVAGIAASAARQWEAAEDHFQTALRQAETVPHLLEQAEIRRFHAMMLRDRAAPGDRERARGLLRQARETYEQIGMRSHGEITQTLLD